MNDYLGGADVSRTKHPNRIAKVREAAGLNASELAAAMGVGNSQVSKLERGENALTQDWMYRIAKALNCSPFELLPEWELRTEDDAMRLIERRFLSLENGSRQEMISRLQDIEPYPFGTPLPPAKSIEREPLIEITIELDGRYRAVVFRPAQKKNDPPEEPQQ